VFFFFFFEAKGFFEQQSWTSKLSTLELGESDLFGERDARIDRKLQ